MDTTLPGTARHCAYCGHLLAHDLVVPERFGEPFCSETHAEEFVAGVRAARIEAVAGRARTQRQNVITRAAGRGLQRHDQHGWTGRLQRAACWGAPVLLLLAISMIWSGGWAATSGSLLGALALLACPLGMYFMMRSMMTIQPQQGTKRPDRGKEAHDA
jgi:hypothetical protein